MQKDIIKRVNKLLDVVKRDPKNIKMFFKHTDGHYEDTDNKGLTFKNDIEFNKYIETQKEITGQEITPIIFIIIDNDISDLERALFNDY